jgi:hypothetical protein
MRTMRTMRTRTMEMAEAEKGDDNNECVWEGKDDRESADASEVAYIYI